MNESKKEKIEVLHPIEMDEFSNDNQVLKERGKNHMYGSLFLNNVLIRIIAQQVYKSSS